MKRLLVVAAIIAAGALCARASTMGWGAVNSNALGLQDGSLAPQGDLVRLGYFDISNAQIQAFAAAGDKTALNNHFFEYDNTTVGNNTAPTFPNGVWSKNSANASSSFFGKNVYYWTLNAATLAGATQWGIFTNPNPSPGNWTFPTDQTGFPPSSGTTDLGDVPHNGTGLIVGSFGGGPDAIFGAPLYKMTAVSPIPEPSTVGFGLLVALGAFCSQRRQRQQRSTGPTSLATCIPPAP